MSPRSTSSGSSLLQRALAPVASTTFPPPSPQDTRGGRPRWDPGLALASILDAVVTLPQVFVEPITHVLSVVSGMVEAVETMRDGKYGFERLLHRVLKFLQSLMDELQTINEPLDADTPTVKRLLALERCVLHDQRTSSVLNYLSLCGSNLIAIRDDAIRCAGLNLLDRFLKRDEIKAALSKHGEELTDCFSMFQVSA